MQTDKLKLSVIMAVHDQAEALEQNLPLFLTRQGEVDYEVIVVDDASTDDTPDVLKRLKTEYPQLYTTFLPASAVPNPSRLRIGLTIGAKASRGQWLMLADITRPPLTEAWADDLFNRFAPKSEVVLTYHNQAGTVQSFDTLDEATPLISKAERRSGRGHRGRFCLFRRGIYGAVMVRRECIHEAISLFDRPFRGGQLLSLRLKVLWSNLF